MVLKLFTESLDDVFEELGHKLDYTLTWGLGHAMSGAGRQLDGTRKADMAFSAPRIGNSISAVRGNINGATLGLRRHEIIAEGKLVDTTKTSS